MKYFILYVAIVLPVVFQSCSSEDEPLNATNLTTESLNNSQILQKDSYKNSRSFSNFETFLMFSVSLE